MMKIPFPIIALIILLISHVSHAELELPTAWPTTAFLATDATLLTASKSKDLLQLTFTGKLICTNKDFQPQLDKEDQHRFYIVRDSSENTGSFELLAEKLESLIGKSCSIDAITTVVRVTGSGIHFAFGNSKFEIKTKTEQGAGANG